MFVLAKLPDMSSNSANIKKKLNNLLSVSSGEKEGNGEDAGDGGNKDTGEEGETIRDDYNNNNTDNTALREYFKSVPDTFSRLEYECELAQRRTRKKIFL